MSDSSWFYWHSNCIPVIFWCSINFKCSISGNIFNPEYCNAFYVLLFSIKVVLFVYNKARGFLHHCKTFSLKSRTNDHVANHSPGVVPAQMPDSKATSGRFQPFGSSQMEQRQSTPPAHALLTFLICKLMNVKKWFYINNNKKNRQSKTLLRPLLLVYEDTNIAEVLVKEISSPRPSRLKISDILMLAGPHSTKDSCSSNHMGSCPYRLGNSLLCKEKGDQLEEILSGDQLPQGLWMLDSKHLCWHPGSRACPVIVIFSEAHPRPQNHSFIICQRMGLWAIKVWRYIRHVCWPLCD